MRTNSEGLPLFPKYGNNVKQTIPIGEITLKEMLEEIKYPSPQRVILFKNIQLAEINGDMDLKRKLKEHIWYCNPAVQTDGKGRSYANITGYTGYLVLDFDKVDDVNLVKRLVFKNTPTIIAAWLSVSGHGFRCIVRIPECKSVDEYKAYFWGVANMGGSDIDGFDMAPQNPILPLFMSYDPDLLYRDNADVSIFRGQKKTEHNWNNIEPIHITDDPKTMDKFKLWSLSNAERAIATINSNGHPQVRAAAYSLGGRVGGGYLTFDEAESHIHSYIAANAYLSKGTKGYQKTATEMLNEGTASPLTF